MKLRLMRILRTLGAMILALSLAGGAHACLALCNAPLSKAVATAATHCSRCVVKQPQRQLPPDHSPCKSCLNIDQDRISAGDDATSQFDFAPATLLEIPALISSDTNIAFLEIPRLRNHHPPSGDLLHHLCVLVI